MKIANLIELYSSLTFFSLVGVLIRIGLDNLYNGINLFNSPMNESVQGLEVSTPMYFDIFANVFGCIVMGFMVQVKQWKEK